ncbi:malate synthase, glyoxysomal-like [Daphnia pulex]|uniref:malate synthase, glyoxysomal-like n=1 Tax=Daphnia pulex TaxID=6669 RepID=UPI001EDF791D|nr:malate synthase, glyoxysomal-like [Daphnia pulex]XP_046454209.1 malate synthase, glyoxysomal-like [Daphnia pulex]XP_046454210.1 malate synthase, glyoxysomal-like [Daphnia pulex]
MLGTKAAATSADRLKVILSHLPKKPGNIPFDFLGSKKSFEISPAPKGLESAITLLFTEDCLEFLVKLVETFDQKADEVLRQRVLRRCAVESGKLPEFVSKRPNKSKGWKIDSIPRRLVNRKLDLGDISPSRTDLLVNALNANVQGIQVDFDDGHCPSWRNQLQGLYNVFLAVRNQLPGTPALDKVPVMMLRPRAWNMMEHNVMINGREIPGPLLDFGVLIYHNGRIMADLDSGPFFYLSKVESASEARLWDQIFTWAENRLGLKFGTIKSCVLIENILATFEMESILYELRHHCIGLNCGIWDYSASIISLFGRRPEFVISDRVRYVNIDQLFLISYIKLLIKVCHKRGALATGGMAALVLDGDDSNNQESIIRRVCESKLKEIRLGLDGFMVHDLGLVTHINKLWNDNCPADNQLKVKLASFKKSAADLLKVPVGQVSLSALEHNISVATLFIEAWLRQSGTFTFRGAVEDSATAEISRSQVWQWIFHRVLLEDVEGTRVSRQLVFDLVDSFAQQLSASFNQVDKDRLLVAVKIFKELVTSRDPPIFITTYLNNHSCFLNACRQSNNGP